MLLTAVTSYVALQTQRIKALNQKDLLALPKDLVVTQQRQSAVDIFTEKK